jgi:hypothetical protein
VFNKFFPSICAGIVFIFLTLHIARSIPNVVFNSDEISWFFHTKFFEELFLKHKFNQNVWSSYESIDHPQLSKYIFGAYLYAGNPTVFSTRDALEKKYGRWSFYLDKRLSDIRITEFVPYILLMREVNGIFTLGTLVCIGILLFQITRVRFIALLLPVIVVFNPLFIQTILRATSDAHMVFFVLATVAILMTNFYRHNRFGPIAAGIVIGSAIAIKLTGIIILYVTVVWEIIRIHTQPYQTTIKRVSVICISAFCIWYVSNPGLYRSPVIGSWKYFQFRSNQSVRLELYLPDIALMTIPSRVNATYCELFDATCSTFKGTPTPNTFINIILFLIGISALYKQRNTKQSHMEIIALFLFVTLFLNTAIVPLNVDRYFLLPVIATYILDAIGISWIMAYLFPVVGKMT